MTTYHFEVLSLRFVDVVFFSRRERPPTGKLMLLGLELQLPSFVR